MHAVQLRELCRDDLLAVVELLARAAVVDGSSHHVSLDDLAAELTAPFVDLGKDGRVAICDGAIVGWIWVWHPSSDDGHESAYLIGEVDPSYRRIGVGRQLMSWSIHRADQRLRDSASQSGTVRVEAYQSALPNIALYQRFGFAAVRWAYELEFDLHNDIDSRVPDDDVVVGSWPPEANDALRKLRNEAFAAVWGAPILDDGEWVSILTEPATRLDMSSVASLRASGEIVGLCLVRSYVGSSGVREAWLHNIATKETQRGRNIASSMITRSLRLLIRSGFDRALISVDSASPTGAPHLYAKLGFRLFRTIVTYERRIGLESSVASPNTRSN